MTTAENKIKEYLINNSINNKTICVALSGGADSVCLLTSLNALKNDFNLTISAVHIQHNLRGEESKRDEDFCVNLCKNLGIELQVHSLDIMGYAERNKISSTEQAARECRYKVFDNIAKDNTLVATAHTSSDNLETIMFRIIRGTGLKGLCGIPMSRGHYIRPMLDLTRADIENHLTEINESFVTDSTNLGDDYTRNYIRHHIVPKMKHINWSVEKSVANMIKSLNEDMSFIEETVEIEYNKNCKYNKLYHLKDMHPAIAKRCLIKYFEDNDISATANNIQIAYDVAMSETKRHEIKRGGTYIVSKDNQFYICNETLSNASMILEPFDTTSNESIRNTITLYGNDQMNLELITNNSRMRSFESKVEFENMMTCAYQNNNMLFVLDYDKVVGNITMHHGRNGLKIKTPNRKHHVKVTQWVASNIEPKDRSRMLYLSDEEGLILAEGIGISERVAVTDDTVNFLFVSINHLEESRRLYDK